MRSNKLCCDHAAGVRRSFDRVFDKAVRGHIRIPRDRQLVRAAIGGKHQRIASDLDGWLHGAARAFLLHNGAGEVNGWNEGSVLVSVAVSEWIGRVDQNGIESATAVFGNFQIVSL